MPALRIFDAAKAREFYAGFLGVAWDWEHRFAPDLPLCAQASRGVLALHLSEHHGDACPIARLRVRVADAAGLDALHAELAARRNPYARPGIERAPWGEGSLTVTNPFRNRLTLHAPHDAGP